MAEAPRWDNSRVKNAGSPPLDYRCLPAFGEETFKGAHLVIPYQSSSGKRYYLILGRDGQVWSVPDGYQGESPPHLVWDSRPELNAAPLGPLPSNGGIQSSLLGGVFDRDWPKQPFLYLACHQRVDPEPRCYIFRIQVSTGDKPLSIEGSPETIISWESNGHNGCDLHWGPEDGFLYFSAGDGSAPGDPNNVGQHVHQIRGSIIRIDVHGPPDPEINYAVPIDNPFLGLPDVRPEIWCYGLRNPWRMCFHPETNELWIGDNGDESWELVHRVKKGTNSGWSAFEGSHPFRTSNPLGGPTLIHTPPRIEHPHPEMRSVIGGVFYRGKQFPELENHYIYGCYVTQEVWAADYDPKTDELGKPFRIARTGGPLTSIREDHDRELILTSIDGQIERLAKRVEEVEKSPWPEKLSGTGLFSRVSALAPNPGVYEYLINAESWSDGATKRRFVAVPPDRTLSAQGGARYYKSLFIEPGGAYVQTLSIDGKPVETQLLYNSGIWQGYTYQWDEDGQDATLVPPEGRDIILPNGRKWRFPSRAECMICHSQRTMFAVAFSPPQLERTGVDGETNQLDHWLELGILRKSAPLKELREKPLANPYDPGSGSIEERARAYLDVNCAHCHREAALGGRASFQLMWYLDLEETGIINADPMVGMLGKPGAKVVAPGRPELSELLDRMNRRGPGQMPLLNSHAIDKDGVALIREWIESMTSKKP